MSQWETESLAASELAFEAYQTAFRALMEGDAPERRRVQLAEVVHWLSMASMRLENIVRWEANHLAMVEREVDAYAHFRAVVA